MLHVPLQQEAKGTWEVEGGIAEGCLWFFSLIPVGILHAFQVQEWAQREQCSEKADDQPVPVGTTRITGTQWLKMSAVSYSSSWH